MKRIADNSNSAKPLRNTARRQDVDLFRGIGIICMILGHIIVNDNAFNHIIHSFHMPMFFIISGMFWKPCDNFVVYFKKKAKSLLFPYFIFGAIHYVVYLIYYFHDSNMPKLTPLIRLIGNNTEGLPIAGALWFLTALFFCEIFYTCIEKANSHIIRGIIITVLAVIGVLIPYLFSTRLPLALDICFVCLPLFAFGHFYKRSDEFNKIWNLGLTISILGIGIIISIVNGAVNVRASHYSIIPLFYIAALFISIGLLKMSAVISELTLPKIIHSIIKGLCFVGNNSIVYLILNQLVILVLAKICQFLPLSKPVVIVSVFAITMIILHICVLILNKKPVNKLLGK